MAGKKAASKTAKHTTPSGTDWARRGEPSDLAILDCQMPGVTKTEKVWRERGQFGSSGRYAEDWEPSPEWEKAEIDALDEIVAGAVDRVQEVIWNAAREAWERIHDSRHPDLCMHDPTLDYLYPKDFAEEVLRKASVNFLEDARRDCEARLRRK